jgi:hypothetical protein
MKKVIFMFEFLSLELSELYGEDKKKLQSKTVLYGHLGEGRWHTHLQPPLSKEDINKFEEEDLKRGVLTQIIGLP